MGYLNIILIILIVVVVIGAALYFLNKFATRRVTEQQKMIDRSKQTASIYVIDKKRDKPENANLPKAATEKMPKIYEFIKMNLVKAKIGPQIVTLMCDRKVFNMMPVKKNVKVELAGLYIVSIKGMRTPEEVRQMHREAALKEKNERRAKAATAKALKKSAIKR